VTLVGNDTGRRDVPARGPSTTSERLGRLVLTPCDAYEEFPPKAFRAADGRRAAYGSDSSRSCSRALAAARSAAARAYGWVSKRADG